MNRRFYHTFYDMSIRAEFVTHAQTYNHMSDLRLPYLMAC